MADAAEEAGQDWYDRKSVLMESMLGKEHDHVMHAIIPYAIGGSLDLYYYTDHTSGTAVATKELSELPGEGSSNNIFECYELVMFTRRQLDLNAATDMETAFGRVHSAIDTVLNHIALFSTQAVLNPNETLEFHSEMPAVGGRCVIFDAYPSYPADRRIEFGLLAIIEIFRAEMDFARENGGAILLERLKTKGHDPYSDLEREPVA